MTIMLATSGELRYTDIQNKLEKLKRPMVPSTLSNALAQLVDRGRLLKREEGKERWYSTAPIQPSRDELVEMITRTDIWAIQMVAEVGLLASLGVTFYGIDKRLPRSLKKRLMAEATDFKEAVDEILRDEAMLLFQRVLAKTKGRLNKKEEREAVKALEYFAEAMPHKRARFKSAAWESELVERYFPTFIDVSHRNWVEEFPGRDTGSDNPAIKQKQVEYIAKLTGRGVETIRREIARRERHARAIRLLLYAAPEKDREWASRQIGAMLLLMENCCAVVR